jgi:hypothetical protein
VLPLLCLKRACEPSGDQIERSEGANSANGLWLLGTLSKLAVSLPYNVMARVAQVSPGEVWTEQTERGFLISVVRALLKPVCITIYY